MRTFAPVAAVAALLLLAGCASAPTGDSSAGAPVPAPASDPQFDEASGGGSDASESSQPAVAAADQSVIVTGWVSMVADAPVDAADEAARLAESAGGAVADRSEAAGADDVPERAELTLRVPADAVDGLLDDLRAVGDVRAVDVSSVDVTQQVQDLDVRVASARASVERLTALLASAADTDTLLEIEAQLTTRTSELESLLAQQASLADQVALSTITVSIASPDVAPRTPPSTFLDGLDAGWAALAATASALAVAAGAALPWLAIAAIVALLVVAIVRATTRRRATSPSAPSSGDAAPPIA